MKKGKWLKFCPIFALSVLISFSLLGVTTSQVLAQSNPEYPKLLRMATFKPGTSLHACASGLAKVATDHTPMSVTVIATQGARLWLPMLTERKTVDMGTEDLNIFWQMWTGKMVPDPAPFTAKPSFPEDKKIRLLMAGPPFLNGIIVRKDSKLREVSELKGKKFGWKGAMPEVLAFLYAHLYNAGLTPDDVIKVPITDSVAGVTAVREGRIDATSAAVGMGAVSEADALVGIRFLRNSTDPERIKAAQRACPGGTPVIAKAGSSPGIREDTPIWSVPIGLIASIFMPDHVAYKLVESWWMYHKEYEPIHPFLKKWTPETFVYKDFPVPYHNGAIQFYKEKGVWGPEMEKAQAVLLKGN